MPNWTRFQNFIKTICINANCLRTTGELSMVDVVPCRTSCHLQHSQYYITTIHTNILYDLAASAALSALVPMCIMTHIIPHVHTYYNYPAAFLALLATMCFMTDINPCTVGTHPARDSTSLVRLSHLQQIKEPSTHGASIECVLSHI